MIQDFDVVVVGAGPGGIAAAAIAAEAGVRVCLLDENPAPGGQLWRGLRAETASGQPHGSSYLHWTNRLQRTGCTVLSGWQAITSPAPSVLRFGRNGEVCDLRYGRLILATGARERFLPFPGWTLPGVMGAGGAQALVKAGLDPRGKRVVVAGSGPLLLAVAAGLRRKGATIVGIYEQAQWKQLAGLGLTLLNQPKKLVEGAGYRLQTLSTPYRTGCWVAEADGYRRLEHLVVTDGRRRWTQNCDWLACGFHLVPNLELPLLLGCRIARGYVEVDSRQATSVADVACVGELTGVGGLEKALLEGAIAGWSAVGRESKACALFWRRQRQLRFAQRLDRAFSLRPELRRLTTAETVICRCEDVRSDALQQVNSWREAKLQTRCGMGACQGRVCGSAAEFLFGWENRGVRPPIYPTAVSTLAAGMDTMQEQEG